MTWSTNSCTICGSVRTVLTSAPIGLLTLVHYTVTVLPVPANTAVQAVLTPHRTDKKRPKELLRETDMQTIQSFLLVSVRTLMTAFSWTVGGTPFLFGPSAVWQMERAFSWRITLYGRNEFLK